ncbi:ABC transporter substrate-binding protein [Demequina aestuarii]|uniref:ABC transporter substrate-binding protein n=1 Tax=Demequina aestuarii TaxID=327095 RepID=UPI0007817064|nr:extracellular solute-binding protein [Demequina aestuarii]
MKFSRKLGATAALAAAGGLVLAGCAGGGTAEEPSQGQTGTNGTSAEGADLSGSVTFRSWSPIEQTTAQMVSAFESDNPGTTIDATIFNYPEYLVDLQTRASSDTFPDIVGLQPGALTQQYRSNLMPLQQCAADTWGDDWQDMFYPIGLEQARAGNPEGDDNFYSLPILVQTVNLWANTQHFADAGQEIPQTWDELKSVVDAMEGNDYAPFLLPAKDGWLRNAVFLQIANNVEPGLVYQAESGDASWTEASIVEAFDYFGRLFSEGIAQEGAIGLDAYPSGANQFEAGNAAMIPLGAWWIQQSDPTKDQSTIPELSLGMEGYEPFLFPTIPGGASESQFVGGIDVSLGISANTENPDLACAVLTDWIAGSGGQKLIDTMNDIPAVQGLNPSEFTSAKQEEIWNTFVEDWLPQVEYSRYFDDPRIDQAVADALAAVATGQQTPDEAAAAVQSVQDEVLAG